MKRRLRAMQTFSKEGIMVIKSKKGMNEKDVYLQEDLYLQVSKKLHSL
jgi:hypothetical protein